MPSDTPPARSEREFFVDFERRFEDTYWRGRYEWELREGTMNQASVVSEIGIKTRGNTWTLWGARREARRARRKVIRARADNGRYLPREAL